MPIDDHITALQLGKSSEFFCVLLIVCGLMLSGCCGGGNELPEGLAARLIDIGTRVEVNAKAAVKDQKLTLKDIIEVFADSFAVIKFPDGTRISLFYDDLNNRNTKLEMSTYEKKTVTTMALKLLDGVIAAVVPKQKTGIDRYEIEAAHTTTAIEGTQVKVSTNGTNDEIALKEGKVKITHKADGKTLELSSRQKVSATATGFSDVETYNGLAESEEKFFLDNPREFYRY